MNETSTLTGIEMDSFGTLPRGTRARRLSAIAAWINERSDILAITATVRPTSVSTDRPLAGTRLVSKGKGRNGNELRIYATRAVNVPSAYNFHWDREVARSRGMTLYAARSEVHKHNSAETYRSNDEVERWLVQWIERLSHAEPQVRRRLAAFNRRLDKR